MKTRLFSFLLSLLFCLSALYGESASKEALRIIEDFQPSLDRLNTGRDGSVLKKALKEITALREQGGLSPEERALLQMYEGAFTTIRARDSFNLFMKKNYLMEGLDLMEGVDIAAFEKIPTLYLRLLIIRGLANAGVPKAFGRKAFAERDLNRVLVAPSFSEVDLEYQKEVTKALGSLQ